MATFIVLLIFEILIIGLNIQIFKHDYFSPATISSITFLIATVFALYCINYWNIELSWLTVIVIILGLFLMTVGEFLGRKILIRSSKNSKETTVSTINVSVYIRTIIAVLVVLVTVLYAINAYHVGIMNGGNSSNSFAYMKMAYATDSSFRMNPIIRQGFKFIMASAYISSYIFANNVLLLKQKLSKNLSYLIIIICAILVTIFSGSRTEILRIISALILDYNVLSRAICHKNESLKSKRNIIFKILPMFILIAIIAFFTRSIVKTTGTATSDTNSFIYYVAYYVGSPIAVLNTKINMAFSGINILKPSSIQLPSFVYLGNLNYGGNVGTILQPYLLNDGLIKMCIGIFLIYFLGGVFYTYILHNSIGNYKRPLCLLILSSWYCIYTMSYYDDIIQQQSFVITLLLIDLVIIVLYPIFFNKKNER